MTQRNRIVRSTMKASTLLIMLASFASLALVQCDSGGVGDPCTPEEEYLENFAGFKLTEENIESRSFQCQTRVCLVNHFQGRVSCPLGQDTPRNCQNDGDCTADGDTCVEAGVILTDCDPTPCSDGGDPANCNESDSSNAACGGRVCEKDGGYCHCSASECPQDYFCDAENNPATGRPKNLCTTKVCSQPDQNDARCYVPGTDIPIAVPVCSQCAAGTRDAANAVYCSCRCGSPVDGESEADENFNFCDCPEGFTCEEIRKNVGLGDAQVAGKYCIKQGTQFTDETTCGQVQGYWGPQCNGTPGAAP
jgi:hypothetical protein